MGVGLTARMWSASTKDAENACRALGVAFIALGRDPHTAYASQRHPDGRHRAYVVVDYRQRPKVAPWVPTERTGA